jgi:hypothetical protein
MENKHASTQANRVNISVQEANSAFEALMTHKRQVRP